MYYAENMTEDNPGSSGEMCQVVSGRRLVRPTSTYTAARDALTLAHCVCVCGQCHDKSCMTSAIEMSDILTQANAALVETLVKALRLLVDYLGVCAVYS